MNYKRGLKYCGGCNNRIERAEYVRGLEKRLGEKLPYVTEEDHYEELYVVCGCPACCPDLSRYSYEKAIYNYDSFRDM